MNATSPKIKRGWIRILLLVIPYLLFIGLFQYAGYEVAGVSLMEIESDATLSMSAHFIISAFSFLGTALIVWLFRRYVDRESFVSLGLQARGFGKETLLGLAMGFGIMGLGYVLLDWADQIAFKQINFNMMDLLLSLGLFVMVALTEELLMRGYVLHNLLKSCNRYVALGISSVIFSLMHGANPNVDWFSLTELTLAGLLFGLSYLYTRSLWFPIALHFSWNFFQGTIFGFNVSGLDHYSLIEQERLMDTIWNGGAFGFEGSVLSVLFQLSCILVVFMIFRKQASGFAPAPVVALSLIHI